MCIYMWQIFDLLDSNNVLVILNKEEGVSFQNYSFWSILLKKSICNYVYISDLTYIKLIGSVYWKSCGHTIFLFHDIEYLTFHIAQLSLENTPDMCWKLISIKGPLWNRLDSVQQLFKASHRECKCWMSCKK